VFATEQRFGQAVERCGFTAVPAGLDPFAPAPWPGYEFSAAVTRSKLADILGLFAAWPFDLILRDPTDFAALLAAEALRVPQATIGFARFIPPHWWRVQLGESLDALRSELGLSLDPEFERLHPSLYIDTVPPWLQATDGPLPMALYRVRHEPFQAPGAQAYAPVLDPSRPLVLVTLGTVYNRRPQLLRDLCLGAVRAGAEVMCTLGPRLDPSDIDLGQLDSVHVTRYVPLAEVLTRCAVVACHGGYNTVLAALSHGLPLIVVPLGADNAFNADRCCELGAAVAEAPDAVTEARAAELVSELLTCDRYRTAARGMAASMADLPPVATAVPLMERLAATGIAHLELATSLR
jgi:UDP:flavonoid glycosyltransferase YjiC (YdhE family)